MKVFLNRNLIDIHGDKVKELPKRPGQQNEEAGDERLGVMLVEGLLRDLQPQDQGVSGGVKMRRYQLAQKITSAMKKDRSSDLAMEISSEDVGMIKQRLAVFVPTTLLGPIYEAIEPSLQEVSETAEG